ncbi:phosphatase PAP2 family protein [Nocardia sp. NPDC049190]|uniref:phosphatase PAP2 family protein n=1 Tax=Nocardia sp. NPDC049190 TaxID=3155650 RepID=UPI0033C901DF
MTSHRVRTAIGVFTALLTVFAVGLTVRVLRDNGRIGIDRDISDWVVAHRNGALSPTAVAISALGGGLAMTVLATLACLGLALGRRWNQAALVAVAGLGSTLLVRGGKKLIDRDRPAVEDHLVSVTNQSYPSGHSLGSFVVVGIVATVLIPRVRRPVLRALAATLAAIFVAAVGLSRIYLGVHWTTDVLAGWCLGALWLIFCLTVYQRLTQPPAENPSPRPTTDQRFGSHTPPDVTHS